MNQDLDLFRFPPDPGRHENNGTALRQSLDGDAQDLALLLRPRVWSNLSLPLGRRFGWGCRRFLRRRLSGRWTLQRRCADGPSRSSLNKETNTLVAGQALQLEQRMRLERSTGQRRLDYGCVTGLRLRTRQPNLVTRGSPRELLFHRLAALGMLPPPHSWQHQALTQRDGGQEVDGLPVRAGERAPPGTGAQRQSISAARRNLS